jgi:hypothetical protein
MLLGLLRWKRPEARLLVAMSCVPQTAYLYEALPLFLIPRRYEEGFVLSLASYAVLLAVKVYEPAWAGLDPVAQYMAERQTMGQWMVWVLYLPCLAMVLRRPNVFAKESTPTKDVNGAAEPNKLFIACQPPSSSSAAISPPNTPTS